MSAITVEGKEFATYRRGTVRIVIAMIAIFCITVGFFSGQFYRKYQKSHSIPQAKIALGNITIIGDNKDLLYMGIQSNLFESHSILAKDYDKGPSFVLISEDGMVKGWLDDFTDKIFDNPPKFTLDFKPKDPKHPTVGEIETVSRSICLEMDLYMIVLPKQG